jgi:hypothetical protein
VWHPGPGLARGSLESPDVALADVVQRSREGLGMEGVSPMSSGVGLAQDYSALLLWAAAPSAASLAALAFSSLCLFCTEPVLYQMLNS